MQEVEEMSPTTKERTEEEEEEEENAGDDDFSFVCLNQSGSPISADDAFVNGQIRPVFPMFDDQRLLLKQDHESFNFKGKEATSSSVVVRPRLKKLFLEEAQDYSTNTSPELFCEWSAPAPALGKKSHSTGFSKLWRFGDKILRRSSSDGKEAFVFLRSDSNGGGGEKAGRSDRKVKVKRTKEETASSLHERHYARNRAENEMNKRKSYLPYRNHLMGFFTTDNGSTTNIHPF